MVGSFPVGEAGGRGGFVYKVRRSQTRRYRGAKTIAVRAGV